MNFAIISPLANEAPDFHPFVNALTKTLDRLGCGTVYFVVDTVSRDNTLSLSQELSRKDHRFVTVWAPQNRHLVDAYLEGYRTAFSNNHEVIIEMDAGLSHDPDAIPEFLSALGRGYECAFGSRFIKGGSIRDSNLKRKFLSRAGTILSNVLLGTKLRDMTSGYQGFHAGVVAQFLQYPLLSTAHFYQTELRYLLRRKRCVEIPIHYRAPSPSVSKKAIANSLCVLWHYSKKRLQGNPAVIE